MKKPMFVLVILLFCFLNLPGQNIVFSSHEPLSLNWTVESDSDSAIIKIENQTLDIISPKGLTLWYNKKLMANLKITYEAMVVKENGKFDRVSDLNCFWMANDPENPDNFFARTSWRHGTFGKYYSLCLYYVGYGGNDNSTTRFRRYDGDFTAFNKNRNRPDILKEYTDTAHLIVPNKWNTIEIIVNNQKIQYWFNHELLFDYYDNMPYLKGYFGIRTVTNHLKIKNIHIDHLQ